MSVRSQRVIRKLYSSAILHSGVKQIASISRQLSLLQTCKHTLHDASPRPTISSQQANRWFEIVCLRQTKTLGAARFSGCHACHQRSLGKRVGCRSGSSFARIMPECGSWLVNTTTTLVSLQCLAIKPFPFWHLQQKRNS